jgi:hypothetical protein
MANYLIALKLMMQFEKALKYNTKQTFSYNNNKVLVLIAIKI